MSGIISGMITRSRAFSTEALKVVNNVAKQQFEVSLRNEAAVLEYTQNGNNIDLNYTKVPESFQGKGVGKLLAQHALLHAQENGLSVICKCHFIAKYYQDNLDKFKDLKIKYDFQN